MRCSRCGPPAATQASLFVLLESYYIGIALHAAQHAFHMSGLHCIALFIFHCYIGVDWLNAIFLPSEADAEQGSHAHQWLPVSRIRFSLSKSGCKEGLTWTSVAS